MYAKTHRTKQKRQTKYYCLYKLYCPRDEDKHICYYCGMPGEQKDHVPALENISYLRMTGLARKADFLKVPCCKECNRLASHEMHLTIHERFMWLKHKLLEKYKKAFLDPVWTEAEMDDAEFDYAFRSAINAKIELKKLLIERIAYGFASVDEARNVLSTHYF